MIMMKRTYCYWIVVFLCWQGSCRLYAADVALSVEGGASGRSLLDLLQAGGWAMLPLGLLSMGTVGFTIYNFVTVRRSNFVNDVLVAQLHHAIATADLEQARSICQSSPSVVTNTLTHGLDQLDQGAWKSEALEKTLETASERELSAAYGVVNYLSIIAALAPMVGLLGTVSGMVKAFNSIASQGMGKPELLADNISEALITTASGMAIAIPAMFFFFFFRNRYGKIVGEVNLVLGKLYARLLHVVPKNRGNDEVEV